MACIGADGTPTESGTRMLKALQSGLRTPEDVAGSTGLPLFRVRSGLRELAGAGLASQQGEAYELSPAGLKLADTLSG